MPNIPAAGQRIEDIGQFKRKELRKPTNLRAVFRDIRNHLAGMTTGITRDEALASEITNVLFCKIYDEINTPLEEYVEFRAGVNESPTDMKQRIEQLFEDEVKKEYSEVFDRTDSISLDEASLLYVVGELQNYCLVEADRDAIGDAFEVFILMVRDGTYLVGISCLLTKYDTKILFQSHIFRLRIIKPELSLHSFCWLSSTALRSKTGQGKTIHPRYHRHTWQSSERNNSPYPQCQTS